MLSQPIPFVNAQAATPRRPHQKLFVKLTVSEHPKPPFDHQSLLT